MIDFFGHEIEPDEAIDFLILLYSFLYSHRRHAGMKILTEGMLVARISWCLRPEIDHTLDENIYFFARACRIAA